MISAIQVDVTNDTLDWLLFGAGLLTALTTLAAVFVALLPMLRQSRRRPQLQLGTSEAFEWRAELGPLSDRVQVVPPVWVTNSAGKESAQEVEVFVTVGEAVGPDNLVHLNLASRQNLSFRDPLDGSGSVPTAHIPSGFSREISFLCFGGSEALLARWLAPALPMDSGAPADRFAVVAIHPVRRDNMVWIGPGIYSTSFHITGSNFDAMLYTGRFKIEQVEREVDGETGAEMSFKWLVRPKLYQHPHGRLFRRHRNAPLPVDSPDVTLGWNEDLPPQASQ